MTFTLPDLSFPKDALEPHMSANTFDYHYGKHHAGYVKKLNAAVEREGLQGKSLLELIRTTDGGTFNNAAQVWNHSFFWLCLCPADKSGAPSGALASALVEQYGSLDGFKDAFKAAASSNFGSGWTWLILNAAGELQIVNTANAATPVSEPTSTALLTLDVWEHAYYLDYQNGRGSYIDNFWRILNWAFVSENHAAAVDALKAA